MNQKRFAMFPIKAQRKEGIIEKVIFVDPGLEGLGWCYYDYIKTLATPKTFVRPTQSGDFSPRGKSWESRAASSWHFFKGILASINPSEVVIEFPEFWQGNSISMAATIKGDLFKLTYQIGGLAHLVSDFGINTPIFIEPRIWKAQLPKSVVVKRLDALGLNVTAWKLSSHQADAIGMGISAQGCL